MPSSLILACIFVGGFLVGFYGRQNDNILLEGIAIGAFLAAATVSCGTMLESAVRRWFLNRQVQKRRGEGPVSKPTAPAP